VIEMRVFEQSYFVITLIFTRCWDYVIYSTRC